MSQGERTCDPESVVSADLWAWRRLPLAVRRWAWTSRGLVSIEEMAVLHGVSESEVFEDKTKTTALHQKLGFLQTLPVMQPNPACAEGARTFLPPRRIWAMSKVAYDTQDSVPSDGWIACPVFLAETLESILPKYSDTLARLKAKSDEFEVNDNRKAAAKARQELSHHTAQHFHQVVCDFVNNREIRGKRAWKHLHAANGRATTRRAVICRNVQERQLIIYMYI